MILIKNALPYICAALAAITIIDTFGAIASRMFHFKYTFLSLFSACIYVLIGYFVSPKSGLSIALLASIITGFYDSTAGWKLCKMCKANFGEHDELVSKMTYDSNLKIMLFVAPFFSFIGYLISNS